MKKHLFIIYLLFALNAKAQIDITINEPISNQLKLADMFNIVITNTSGSDMQVNLEGTLKTRKGDMVVRGVTGSFSVKAGVSFINPISLSIQYTFYKQNIQSGSDIPYGEYVLCCTLMDGGSGANQCIEMNVNPLTPPFLTFPENGASLELGQVNFIWQPVAPIKQNQLVFYDLAVVKLLPNQTCAQAITMNNKVFNERNLSQTQLNYPISAIPLDTGVSYCWQVKAKTNEYSIGETEVWMFSVMDPMRRLPLKPLPFIVLKRESDAAVYNSENGKLNFMFQEPYFTKEFNYEIINLKTNKIVSSDCFKNGVKQLGDNQYVIDFSLCNVPNGIYKLDVYNEKNEKFSVKFNLQ